MEPPGDVYSCVQEARIFISGTEDAGATFDKIEKDWSCLSVKEIALCKKTTIDVYKLHKEGQSESTIRNAIYYSGAWTAGICKERRKVE